MISKESYVHPKTNLRTVRGLFSVFAKKNELIKLDSKFIDKTYRRFHDNELNSNISIYHSNYDDPYIVEGHPLAEVVIHFAPNDKILDFKVKFCFGDTKIRVFALNKELELSYHDES